MDGLVDNNSWCRGGFHKFDHQSTIFLNFNGDSIQYISQTSFIREITPQISLGVVAFPYKPLSLLGGISFGGINKINFGSGLDIKIRSFCLHLAGSQSGGILNSAKGFKISSDFRFLF